MATQKKFFSDLGLETSQNLSIDGNATISGDLTVNGTSTTINSSITSVEDNMLELANGNTLSDTIDIGFYGNYDDGLSDGGASEYTGLFRDATDSTWKLFDGLEVEPDSTVNTSGTGYSLADLQVGDLTATTLTATNALTGSSMTYPTSDGTNGQVLTTDGAGTLSFSTVSGTTINNNADNRIITGSGTANTLEGEANFTFDGTTTVINNTGNADSTLLQLKNTPSTAGTYKTGLEFWSNEGTANNQTFNAGRIYSEFDGSNYANTRLTLGSASGSGSFNDEINITNGNVGIGTDSPSEALSVSGNLEIIRTAPHLDLMEDGVTDSNHRFRQNAGNLYIQKLSDDKGTSTDRIVLDGGTGNVGIGTTTPSGEFHVDSSLAPCDIHFTTGSISGTGYDVNLNLTGGANNSEMNINMGIAGNADREQIKTYQSTMRFTTADTERMRIHSGGQITAGYQPCFMCYPTSSFTASGGSVKYTFESEAFDNQNEYNHTTGRFTAPIAGKYLFMAELAIQASISALSYAGIGVRVNGSGAVYFGGWGHKSDGANNTSSAQYAKTNSSVILNLAQGDYIELYIELSGSHIVLGGGGGQYTRLMGHLLTA